MMDSTTSASSEQELLRLRNEGKITEAEYQDLLAAMRKAPSREEDQPDASGPGCASQIERPKGGNIPPVLWIALVSLAVMIVAKVLGAFQLGPQILVDAALSAALLVGLYLGHKWAYVATIVLVALSAVLACSKGTEYGLTVLLVNCLVLVPMILARDYFFPKPARTGDN